MKPWIDQSITDGVSQRQRHPAALEPGYFLPEERGFEQLLTLGLELAQTLPFHGSKHGSSGNWGVLFTRDAAVVMAQILARNDRLLTAIFSDSVHRNPEAASLRIFDLVTEFDTWLQQLSMSDNRAGIELGDRVLGLIREHLAASLATLLTMQLSNPSLNQQTDNSLPKTLDPAWGLRSFKPNQTFTGDPRPELLRIHAVFIVALRQLQSIVRPYFNEAMTKQGHDPAVSLFMVYLRLLESAGKRLNTFTERHLAFYYKRVLEARPARAIPEYLHLVLGVQKTPDPIRLPAGSVFTTPTANGEETGYITAESAQLGNATVDSVYSLCFERDRYISPERELGQVTRIKALKFDASKPVSSIPLFRVDAASGAEDARIGFAISSPMFLLQEGQRSIELVMALSDPGDAAAMREAVLSREKEYSDHTVHLTAMFQVFLATEPFLTPQSVLIPDLAKRMADGVSHDIYESVRRSTMDSARNCMFDLFIFSLLNQLEHDVASAQRLLGRLFQRHLLCDIHPDPNFQRQVLKQAEKWINEHDLEQLLPLFSISPNIAFQQLFKNTFRIDLSGSNGWQNVAHYSLERLDFDSDKGYCNLRCRFKLGAETVGIVPATLDLHGAPWDSTAPVMRLRLNHHAHFCAYSLFRIAVLHHVNIRVKVKGLRQLRVFNQYGALDPGKPFQPFGPVPTLNSYLEFDGYELALKPLTTLQLNLNWSDLPRNFGGFSNHYLGYDAPPREQNFIAELALRRDGVWQPPQERRQHAVLFRSVKATDRIEPECTVEFSQLDGYKPRRADINQTEFNLQPEISSSGFRLQLIGPEGAFGHAKYPLLLSRVLSENIRSKKQRVLPQAPYTPLLAGISVDYEAEARITLNESSSENAIDVYQCIHHLHPFGSERLNPVRSDRPYRLMPGYATDGNLFISLRGDLSAGTIRLLFHLSGHNSRHYMQSNASLSWFYLSQRGWQHLPLSHRISDDTANFQRTGVVELQLPEDLARNSPVMPDACAWLRLGANFNLDDFPRIQGVYSNGVRVHRRLEDQNHAAIDTTDKLTWASTELIAGLGAIQAIGEPIPGRPSEDNRQLRTRLSERLRHKNRAVCAWDYERLVLQHFPEVYKVKCIRCLDTAFDKPQPGRVCVVVVPYGNVTEEGSCSLPMINAATVQEIKHKLDSLAPPHTRIEVRNPLYERIQVRCKVQFPNDAIIGFQVQKLNSDISNFICPWTPSGLSARFGWSISRDEVEGYIRSLDYVSYLTDFSMLQMTEDTLDQYYLGDTANALQSSRPARSLSWRHPWSLAVPMSHHFIQALNNNFSIVPEPVGIGELEVSGSFIISGNSNGQTTS